MRFKVRQADVQTPNTAEIWVYNLSGQTAQNVINEFNSVTLQAGYVTGNYGIIFQGTIKQYKRGKESAIDSYLEIFAADGDLAYNHAQISTTLAAGTTLTDRYNALVKAHQDAQPGLSAAPPPQTSSSLGGVLPRGQVLYGMGADEVRDYNRASQTSWSIQNGVIQARPQGSYLPGEAVVLTAQTGLIGMPEATQQGINSRAC